MLQHWLAAALLACCIAAAAPHAPHAPRPARAASLLGAVAPVSGRSCAAGRHPSSGAGGHHHPHGAPSRGSGAVNVSAASGNYARGLQDASTKLDCCCGFFEDVNTGYCDVASEMYAVGDVYDGVSSAYVKYLPSSLSASLLTAPPMLPGPEHFYYVDVPPGVDTLVADTCGNLAAYPVNVTLSILNSCPRKYAGAASAVNGSITMPPGTVLEVNNDVRRSAYTNCSKLVINAAGNDTRAALPLRFRDDFNASMAVYFNPPPGRYFIVVDTDGTQNATDVYTVFVTLIFKEGQATNSSIPSPLYASMTLTPSPTPSPDYSDTPYATVTPSPSASPTPSRTSQAWTVLPTPLACCDGTDDMPFLNGDSGVFTFQTIADTNFQFAADLGADGVFTFGGPDLFLAIDVPSDTVSLTIDTCLTTGEVTDTFIAALVTSPWSLPGLSVNAPVTGLISPGLLAYNDDDLTGTCPLAAGGSPSLLSLLRIDVPPPGRLYFAIDTYDPSTSPLNVRVRWSLTRNPALNATRASTPQLRYPGCRYTAAPSVTPTPTMTPTPSSTSTPSATASSTSTASASPTSAATVSASSTGTASATVSASSSGSPSVTPTGTATPTGTPSGTATPTGTPSSSGAPSSSATGTGSATATPSGSVSPSVTASASASATGTGSSTATPTGSAAATGTPSGTGSASGSPSGTATATGSSSGSASAGASVSSSATGSASAAGTPSASGTATASGVATASPTGTASGSAVASGSPSGTPSPSATATASGAGSATLSRSPSGPRPSTCPPGSKGVPSSLDLRAAILQVPMVMNRTILAVKVGRPVSSALLDLVTPEEVCALRVVIAFSAGVPLANVSLATLNCSTAVPPSLNGCDCIDTLAAFRGQPVQEATPCSFSNVTDGSGSGGSIGSSNSSSSAAPSAAAAAAASAIAAGAGASPSVPASVALLNNPALCPALLVFNVSVNASGVSLPVAQGGLKAASAPGGAYACSTFSQLLPFLDTLANNSTGGGAGNGTGNGTTSGTAGASGGSGGSGGGSPGGGVSNIINDPDVPGDGGGGGGGGSAGGGGPSNALGLEPLLANDPRPTVPPSTPSPLAATPPPVDESGASITAPLLGALAGVLALLLLLLLLARRRRKARQRKKMLSGGASAGAGGASGSGEAPDAEEAAVEVAPPEALSGAGANGGSRAAAASAVAGFNPMVASDAIGSAPSLHRDGSAISRTPNLQAEASRRRIVMNEDGTLSDGSERMIATSSRWRDSGDGDREGFGGRHVRGNPGGLYGGPSNRFGHLQPPGARGTGSPGSSSRSGSAADDDGGMGAMGSKFSSRALLSGDDDRTGFRPLNRTLTGGASNRVLLGGKGLPSPANSGRGRLVQGGGGSATSVTNPALGAMPAGPRTPGLRLMSGNFGDAAAAALSSSGSGSKLRPQLSALGSGAL